MTTTKLSTIIFIFSIAAASNRFVQLSKQIFKYSIKFTKIN